MAITLDQLLYGIRKVESGGNYSVVNSIGAVGAYQVMKANIPSWTKKALGYSMTWQQFRDSKAAQDKVARVILGGYFSKYGAEGAASMWFSGQPNPNSRASDGGNTVRQYVNKVVSASGGGSLTSGGGSYSSGTAPVTARLDPDELAESYGLTSAMIGSSKELATLFSKAVSGGWTATKFQAELKNSNWWKNQSSSLRKYVTTRFTDPATWKQQRTQALVTMNQLAVKLGLGDQINRTTGKASKLLVQAAYNSQALGWSEGQLRDWLGTKATVNGGIMFGEAGEAFDKLHEIAYLNGMSYSADWYRSHSVAVVAGKATLSTYEDQIRAAAAARYSAFADQIKAGQNALDLAAPYVKSLSAILEVPETDVDLFNTHIAKAMTSKPATGQQAGSQMPLWQFENEVRADPLWRKTNNAREGMMSVAHQVAKDFGLVY